MPESLANLTCFPAIIKPELNKAKIARKTAIIEKNKIVNHNGEGAAETAATLVVGIEE